jgi:hypothetical protein
LKGACFKDDQKEEKRVAVAKAQVKLRPFEELLVCQVVRQEAIIRLLVEKRIFTKEEFLEKE